MRVVVEYKCSSSGIDVSVPQEPFIDVVVQCTYH